MIGPQTGFIPGARCAKVNIGSRKLRLQIWPIPARIATSAVLSDWANKVKHLWTEDEWAEATRVHNAMTDAEKTAKGHTEDNCFEVAWDREYARVSVNGTRPNNVRRHMADWLATRWKLGRDDADSMRAALAGHSAEDAKNVAAHVDAAVKRGNARNPVGLLIARLRRTET